MRRKCDPKTDITSRFPNPECQLQFVFSFAFAEIHPRPIRAFAGSLNDPIYPKRNINMITYSISFPVKKGIAKTNILYFCWWNDFKAGYTFLIYIPIFITCIRFKNRDPLVLSLNSTSDIAISVRDTNARRINITTNSSALLTQSPGRKKVLLI